MPLPLRAGGEPSASASWEMDSGGETGEFAAGAGIARIRAASRRTASAASSGASGMNLGSASLIS